MSAAEGVEPSAFDSELNALPLRAIRKCHESCF